VDFIEDALDRIRDQLPNFVHLDELVLHVLDLLVADFLPDLAVFNIGPKFALGTELVVLPRII
jgi:hypothetical protein